MPTDTEGPLKVYSVSHGHGKSHCLTWFAAHNDEQAKALWHNQFKHRKITEIRSVKCLRNVTNVDTVDNPGLIAFAGFGVDGPVVSCNIQYRAEDVKS